MRRKLLGAGWPETMDLSDLPLVILLLMFLSGNIIQSMSNHKKAVSLYNANDTILQLDYSNINATLFGKDTAFFVEFYSSWCGHCIHFAPQWRKLAADTYQVSSPGLLSQCRIFKIEITTCPILCWLKFILIYHSGRKWYRWEPSTARPRRIFQFAPHSRSKDFLRLNFSPLAQSPAKKGSR